MFLLGAITVVGVVVLGCLTGMCMQRIEKRDLFVRMMTDVPTTRGEFVIMGKGGQIFAHSHTYSKALDQARKEHPYDLTKVTVYFLHPERVRTLIYEGNLN